MKFKKSWQDVYRRYLSLQAMARRAVRRLFIRETALVLGDSHAWVFYHWWFDRQLPNVLIDVCVVAGATASGLENPNSKTQAYQKFEEAIQRHPAKWYILQLGEVDTGFVIWYRAQKYNSSVEEMLDQTVEKYGNFIQKLSSLGRVVVVSAPLPTIPDDNPCGEVANLRKEVKVSQRQRIDLTLSFNQQIARVCAANRATFLDLDSDSLGPNGLVKPSLLNADPCDHHYDLPAYARLLSAKLTSVFS